MVMDLQILMIIYRREISVMSGVFSNHWVTLLRDHRFLRWFWLYLGTPSVDMREKEVLIKSKSCSMEYGRVSE
jgi:hypothetical protein